MGQLRILVLVFAAILVFCDLGLAQEWPRPLPLVYGGLALKGGGGYAPAAGLLGARCELPVWHLTFAAEASYAAVRKANDNTGINPKGRERALEGEIRFRLHRYWFVGPVLSWGELNTTNYRKSSWHPGFGAGRDFSWMRLSGDFLLAGSDHLNGSKAFVIDAYFPSPARNRGHFFFRETIEIYRFHATVTDWSDAELTRRQLADRSGGSETEMTFGVRF